jgi:hypothetical protein
MQEKKLMLEKNGPHLARISVFEVSNYLTFDPFIACLYFYITMPLLAWIKVFSFLRTDLFEKSQVLAMKTGYIANYFSLV